MSSTAQGNQKDPLWLHKNLLKLRWTEETIAANYKAGGMQTPTHLGTGQEAIAVGICGALGDGDVAYSHHRCHNHYLAMGGEVRDLLAELHGRVTGCSRGKGGSVHLTARSHGFIVSSAILGETVACAVGSALAFKMDKQPNVAVTFLGDATCEEGILYECLNFAATNRLPVLFVCENNLYSTESPLNMRQPAGTKLTERAEAFKLGTLKGDGNDVAEVHRLGLEAAEMCRQGKPMFVELSTYRWREHVGPNLDHEVGRTYRTKEEFDQWLERDPVKLSGERLLKEGLVSEEGLEALSQEVSSQIGRLFEEVQSDPWPDVDELFRHIH